MKRLFSVFFFIVLMTRGGAYAYADAWPDATIGSGLGVAAKPERTGPDQLRRIKAAGFSYIRFDMRWDEVELAPSDYHWDAMDSFVNALRKYHLKPLIILDDSNPLYGEKVSVPPEVSFGADTAYAAPTTGEGRKAFAAFAAAAVARYGTDDIIWEIWNEPDMIAFWPPKPNATDFSLLADTTCRAMRAVAPKAKIIGPAIARLPNQSDFLHSDFFKTFIQSPTKDCLDAISVHPYRAEHAPETVIDDYQNKVRPFIASYTSKDAKPLPIVDSEWGYSATDVTPQQQAEYPLRMRLSDMLGGVPLTILYEWQDSAGMKDPRETHFGLIDASGNNKPSVDIIDDLLPRIKNAVIIRRLPLDNEDAFALLLKQPSGQHQILAWMGLKKLNHTWILNIKNLGEKQPRPYELTLVPRLIDINSPEPNVTVITEDLKSVP